MSLCNFTLQLDNVFCIVVVASNIFTSCIYCIAMATASQCTVTILLSFSPVPIVCTVSGHDKICCFCELCSVSVFFVGLKNPSGHPEYRRGPNFVHEFVAGVVLVERVDPLLLQQAAMKGPRRSLKEQAVCKAAQRDPLLTHS